MPERDYRLLRPKMFDLPSFGGAAKYCDRATGALVSAFEADLDFQIVLPPTAKRKETKRKLAYRVAIESKAFSVSFLEAGDEPADAKIRFHRKEHVRMRPDAEADAREKLKAAMAGPRQDKPVSDGGSIRGFGKSARTKTPGFMIFRDDVSGRVSALDFDEFEKRFKPA